MNRAAWFAPGPKSPAPPRTGLGTGTGTRNDIFRSVTRFLGMDLLTLLVLIFLLAMSLFLRDFMR